MRYFIVIACVAFLTSISSGAVPALLTVKIYGPDTSGVFDGVVLKKDNSTTISGNNGIVNLSVVESPDGLTWNDGLNSVGPFAMPWIGQGIQVGSYVYVPTDIEWVGFDTESVLSPLMIGMSIAFILHVGCVLCSWFIGDFLDTLRWGFR
jgi:hypothetical protein